MALGSGYASHEAFTRAFRDQFGVTPEDLRQRGTPEGLASVSPIEFKLPAHVRVGSPRIAAEPSLRFVGLAESRSFEETAKIPAQWQRFMEFYGAIDHKRAEIPVGVVQPADETDASRTRAPSKCRASVLIQSH